MKPEAIRLSVKSGDTEMENLTLEKDVVDLLKVSRSTLWKWRTQLKCPSVKIGRKVFYNIDALIDWWRIQEEKSNESHN